MPKSRTFIPLVRNWVSSLPGISLSNTDAGGMGRGIQMNRIERGAPRKNAFVDARQAQRCVRGMYSGFSLYLTVKTRHVDLYPNRFGYI